jgi:hypothetical protein
MKGTSGGSRNVPFALALVLGCVPGALFAHIAPMDAREMVAASPDVVVAVVEGRESRWNPQHTLIETNYSLRVEDRLRGHAPERLTLSIPGGTVDGVTDDTCVTVRLATGARYLLFLNDLQQATLSPITGAAGGMVREVPDPAGSLVALGEGRKPLAVKGRPVRFADFLEAVRGLIAEVEARPEPETSGTPRAQGSLPAKVDVSATPQGLQEAHEKFVFQELSITPVFVRSLPADSPFSPVDQELMAYWNLYGGDIFRALPATAAWAWGNGFFDLAGFPDDAQMTSNFQRNWGSLGARVLGVTFSRRQGGTITEADIALNPGFDWTLDDRVATARNATFSFREAMLHELGHMWGLKHPWETQEVDWDSVMNYRSKLYDVHMLTADDATAVRSAHPGVSVSIHDGLISSYTPLFDAFNLFPQLIPARPSVSSLKRGKSFNVINPIKVENPGTEPISNFTVEVYLAPQQFSFDHAIRLKTIKVPGTLEPSAVQRIDVGKVTVPRNAPAGTYFLAFRLLDPQDEFLENNGAWTIQDVKLTVKLR